MDLKNRADATLIQVRRDLEEHGGKVSPETRGAIESALSGLETALKGDDATAIERAVAELDKSRMELGKAVYEAAGKNAPPGAAQPGPGSTGTAPPPGGAPNDVIDADFEVKDDR